MTPPVLDASALIAVILQEPGADAVRGQLEGAMLSTVNLAEAAGLLIRAGSSRNEVYRRLAQLPLSIVPATADHALDAAALIPATRACGLSLGDRFCLALARAERRIALTGDRAWARLDLEGVEIRLIR